MVGCCVGVLLFTSFVVPLLCRSASLHILWNVYVYRSTPALRSSVFRTVSGAAQRNSNRGFMRLVDGKSHTMYVYICAYICVYRSTHCFAAQRNEDLLRHGATKQ